MLSVALWSALEEKVGWVLKSSGNFLSNKHKNIIILWRNSWEKWGKRCLPPLKCEKPPKYLYFDKNVSFASKTLLTSRNHPKTWEAQIIKWIISGVPPVDLKSQQDSKLGHNWAIHYFTNLLPPCILRTGSCFRNSVKFLELCFILQSLQLFSNFLKEWRDCWPWVHIYQTDVLLSH